MVGSSVSEPKRGQASAVKAWPCCTPSAACTLLNSWLFSALIAGQGSQPAGQAAGGQPAAAGPVPQRSRAARGKPGCLELWGPCWAVHTVCAHCKAL